MCLEVATNAKTNRLFFPICKGIMASRNVKRNLVPHGGPKCGQGPELPPASQGPRVRAWGQGPRIREGVLAEEKPRASPTSSTPSTPSLDLREALDLEAKGVSSESECTMETESSVEKVVTDSNNSSEEKGYLFLVVWVCKARPVYSFLTLSLPWLKPKRLKPKP